MSKGSVYIYNNKFLATNDIKDVAKFPTLKVYDWYLTKAEDEIMNTIKFNNISYTIKSNNIPTKGHILGAVPDSSGYWDVIDENYKKLEYDERESKRNEHGTWNNLKTITDGEDIVIEIPVSWVKTETISNGTYAGRTCYWIADYPAEGFHIHPCFLFSNGTAGNLWVGKYISSIGDNNLPVSKSYDIDSTQIDPDAGNYKKDGLFYFNSNLSNAKAIVNNKNSEYVKGWKYFNIYDSSFIARMMLIEVKELDLHNIYKNYNVESNKIVNLIPNLAGINWYGACFIDGINTLNGRYNIISPNNLNSYVNTNVECPYKTSTSNNKTHYSEIWVSKCLTGIHNGINFDDIFLPPKDGTTSSKSNTFKANISFNPVEGAVAYLCGQNDSGDETLLSLRTTKDDFTPVIKNGKDQSWACTSRLSRIVPLDMPKYKGSLEYNGEEQSPTWNIDTSKFNLSGQTLGTEIGKYYTLFTPKNGNTWQDGTTDTRKVSWNIDKLKFYIKYMPGMVIPISVRTNYPSQNILGEVTSKDGTLLNEKLGFENAFNILNNIGYMAYINILTPISNPMSINLLFDGNMILLDVFLQEQLLEEQMIEAEIIFQAESDVSKFGGLIDYNNEIITEPGCDRFPVGIHLMPEQM